MVGLLIALAAGLGIVLVIRRILFGKRIRNVGVTHMVVRPPARWIISPRLGPPIVMSYSVGSTPFSASRRSARVQ